MLIIDKTAKTWFVNVGAFRLPHPLREGIFFDPAVKCLVEEDEWMLTQPTLIPTTIDEDTSEIQLVPTQPGSPQFDLAADQEAARAAAEKLVTDKADRKSKKDADKPAETAEVAQ